MSFTIFDKVSNLKTLFLCSIPPQVNISSINYLQKLLNYLGYLQRFSIFPSRENVLGKSPEFSRPLFNPPTSFLNFFVPIHFGGKFSCQKSVTQDIRELGLSLRLNNCTILQVKHINWSRKHNTSFFVFFTNISNMCARFPLNLKNKNVIK